MRKLKKYSKKSLPGAVALALAISSAATFPAAADECGELIDKVSAAMSTANLSSDDVVKIETARATALEKHTAGDLEGCMKY